ncbi:MAG: hypothetical protein WCE90_11220 [Candidatus Zixiibacteriota bacterium]
MMEKSVILPEGTPVKVTMSADDKGCVSLGIRIDGGSNYLLESNVTLPKPGKSKSWTSYVGEMV